MSFGGENPNDEPNKKKNQRPSLESKKERLSKGRISRTHSSNGIERSSGGRHSFPFVMEEEKNLEIQKKQDPSPENDEPFVASNI